MTAMLHAVTHFSLVLLVISWLPAPVDARGGSKNYYADKARGWFWREPIPVQPKQLKPPKTTTSSKTPNDRSAPLKPPPLSTAWFRQELGHFRDRAIDDPTPENLHRYFTLQRILLDKAHRFTEAAHEVVISDPALDENSRRPIATFGVHEANHQAREATEEALHHIAQRLGLLFVFRSDCRYCHLEAPLIKSLESRHGFEVIPLSLDGKPMPGSLYPTFRTNQGEAESLGLSATPALFLMEPPGRIVPVAEGLIALEELTQRLITIAHRDGYLSDGLWLKTQGEQAVRSPDYGHLLLNQSPGEFSIP